MRVCMIDFMSGIVHLMKPMKPILDYLTWFIFHFISTSNPRNVDAEPTYPIQIPPTTSRSGKYQLHNGKGFLTDQKLYSNTTHISCCHHCQPTASHGAEESSIIEDRAILKLCARWEAEGGKAGRLNQSKLSIIVGWTRTYLALVVAMQTLFCT